MITVTKDEHGPPVHCLLCGKSGLIAPARFHQMYSQPNTASVSVSWWECRSCYGWFAFPVPTFEQIAQHWQTIDYNDPRQQQEIGVSKEPFFYSLLAELAQWGEKGPLLDIGCNFGHFLNLAKEEGWIPSGYEPYETATKVARAKGFEVRSGWSLDAAGFPVSSFAALTVLDVFCYVRDPIATLRTFHRLLRPGGVLAIRTTNKRFILGLLRAFTRDDPVRDIRISRILKGQFHAISPASLRQIVSRTGFDEVCIRSGATTTPLRVAGWRTRVAYLGASTISLLSLRQINVSPGIFLFARKAKADSEERSSLMRVG